MEVSEDKLLGAAWDSLRSSNWKALHAATGEGGKPIIITHLEAIVLS